MPSDESSSAYAKTQWDGFQLSLVRIYEGLASPSQLMVPGFLAHTVVIWQVLEGEALVRIQECEVRAKAGDWLVCLPGERFQCFAEGTRLLSIHLRVECPSNAARWVGPRFVRLVPDGSLKRAASKLRKMAVHWGMCADGFTNRQSMIPLPGALALQISTATLLMLLLSGLAEYGVRFESAGSKDARVNKGLKWLMDQPLSLGFSRARLAQFVGISPSRLDRIWAQEVGVTPYQYWENRRFKYACDRLREPDSLVKEIAFEVGFSNVSQFSTWFRAHAGESPRAFRARLDLV